MKIKIITDSTIYFDQPDLDKYGIERVDLQVTVGEESHPESECTCDFVMKGFADNKKVLSAQPAPAKFAEVFAKYKDEYDYIICFTLPKSLSGTYQSATIGADLAEATNVRIFPINKCAFGAENFIMANYNDIQNATNIDDLMELLEKRNQNGALLFKISNLMHLHDSGRLSGGKAFVATLLKIKAVIGQYPEDGSLHNVAKFRKNDQVISYFIDQLKEKSQGAKQIYIRLINLKEDEMANIMRDEVKKNFPNAIITETNHLGPVFTVHLGDQGFGICMTTID